MPRARLLLLALAAALGAALPAAAAPLRVVAFGDSLTMGKGSTHGAGYRLAFLQRMAAAGYEVDMLGSSRDGPEGMDGDHEGYPGRGVAKLDEVSFGELRRDHPDAILLMIGTNDANEDFLHEAFRIRFSVLLDRFLADSKVRVVVSTVPPGRYARARSNQVKVAVNEVIRAEVEKQRAAGKRIRLIDAFPLFGDPGDFVDTLHLNDASYDELGNAFADALLGLMQEYPLPPAEAAAGGAGLEPGEAGEGETAGPGEGEEAGAGEP